MDSVFTEKDMMVYAYNPITEGAESEGSLVETSLRYTATPCLKTEQTNKYTLTFLYN